MSRFGEIPLFRGLDENELEVLRAIMQTVEVQKGEVLFEEGSPPEKVYVVKRGTIRIFSSRFQDEETFTTLAAGDLFGEIGVLKSQPRSASAVAEEFSVLYAFESEAFLALVERHPEIRNLVNQTMFGRFRADARRAERRQNRQAEVQNGNPLPGATLIPLFSGTGGVGTSFVTANLATFVAEITQKRVLVVDLDLMFGDQGSIFGLGKGPSFSDLVMEELLDRDLVRGAVRSTSVGVDVLEAPRLPEQAEFVDPELVSRTLELLRPCYDFIFCDTSNQIVDITLDLFEQAQLPLYVLTPELISVKNGKRWLSVIERIGMCSENLRLLVNKVEGSDETSLSYVRRQFGSKILDEAPFDALSAKTSMNMGQPLLVASPRAPVSVALRRAAGQLVGLEIDTAAQAEPFWKRWL